MGCAYKVNKIKIYSHARFCFSSAGTELVSAHADGKIAVLSIGNPEGPTLVRSFYSKQYKLQAFSDYFTSSWKICIFP